MFTEDAHKKKTSIRRSGIAIMNDLPSGGESNGHVPDRDPVDRVFADRPVARRVHSVLKQRARNRKIAQWYLGALATLDSGRHPDRIAQVAHGIREILTYLPRELGVYEKKPPSPIAHMNILSQALEVLEKKRNSKGGANPAVEAKFLRRVEKEIQSYRKGKLGRDKQVSMLMSKFDPQRMSLSASIRKAENKRYRELWSYFDAVAHHEPTTEGELEDRISAVERMIVDVLDREAFEDQSEIDKMIEEGEREATE